MTIFKSGVVVWNLHPEVEFALRDGGAPDRVFEDEADRPAIVTSVRGGTHRKNSLHWLGKAFDLRTNDLSFSSGSRADNLERLRHLLQDELNDDCDQRLWRVIFEYVGEPREHIHAQWEGI